MRKMMTKEVTVTTVKSAKMEVKDGMPVAVPLEDQKVLGAISQEKAMKMVQAEHGLTAMVFGLETETLVYQMAVEDFIKVATLKTDDSQDEEEEEESSEVIVAKGVRVKSTKSE